MKKKIVILGSTSSIGKSLLNIIKKDKKNIKIELLTANTNYKDLISQAKKFNVKNLIITDPVSFKKTKILCKDKGINIFHNFESLKKKDSSSTHSTKEPEIFDCFFPSRSSISSSL